jgi:DnaK suppressor protein
MKTAPSEQLRKVRGILDHERTCSLARIRELRNEQLQDRMSAPGDELDEARALADLETYAGLIEWEQDRLKVIDAAITRLEQNRYGLCEACGNEVPTARLDSLPYAAYCVECQQRRNNSSRPVMGSIDKASSKLWTSPMETDESSGQEDALVAPEDQLFVHDKQPFGTELGEFEPAPPVVTTTPLRSGTKQSRKP